MQIKNKILLLIITTFTTSSYGMFCPNGFNMINVGDSIASVEQQCGKPTSQKVYESSVDKPQEWTYYVKSQPSDQATLRMTVAFTSGVVTNMSVNGIGVTNTQICGGNTVQIGDSEDTIKKGCGTPAFIAQSNLPQAAGDVTKVTELTYSTSAESIILTFDDGKLKSRK